MTKQFKVGDKVRVLNVEGIIGGSKNWKNGDVTEVTEVDEHNVWLERTSEEYSVQLPFLRKNELRYIELIPKKPNRMAELEARVDVLERQLSELSAKKSKPATVIVKSPNESRKATIERAKAFLEESKTDLSLKRGRGYVVGEIRRICNVEYIVDSEKRTVVALLKWRHDGKVYAKGIAKCAPDDVFNADIGKAIALGRALGVDVSEFENAVKPTEVVVGMVIKHVECDDVYTIEGMPGKFRYDMRHEDGAYYDNFGVGEPIENFYAIIDDTEAQY